MFEFDVSSYNGNALSYSNYLLHKVTTARSELSSNMFVLFVCLFVLFVVGGGFFYFWQTFVLTFSKSVGWNSDLSANHSKKAKYVILEQNYSYGRSQQSNCQWLIISSGGNEGCRCQQKQNPLVNALLSFFFFFFFFLENSSFGVSDAKMFAISMAEKRKHQQSLLTSITSW